MTWTGSSHVCECEDRTIHQGRFKRCRKRASIRIRLADTRTLRDVNAGRLTPEPGPWWRYCAGCAHAILKKQGSYVEAEGGAS